MVLMDERTFEHGRLTLKEGDITKQETEAIVNAANSSLMGGGGVDGAIHRAGGPSILFECKEIVKSMGRLPPGQAVITTAGDMPSRYVIHTVGPIWRGGGQDEARTLASCYTESLKLAQQRGIGSVSFPSISTGAYGYPLDEAARVSLETVARFLEEEDGVEEVVFVLWGKEALEAHRRALKDIG
jgi:O-acetyl-ADP-ribose deacetylase (regulator of RNase III)